MKKIVITLLLILALLGCFLQSRLFTGNAAGLITIAVVGPLNTSKGQSMRKGVELYKDQVNQRGGIRGRKLQLLFYDDKNDPATAAHIATEISANPSIHLVLGHAVSETSAIAGRIYKRNEIPAITASIIADSAIAGNKWYFRSIPGNIAEAVFAANYIKSRYINNNHARNNIQKKSAGIVFSDDEYGTTLAENFEQTIESLGIQLTGKWKLNVEQPPENQLQAIASELAAMDNPGIIYFATQAIADAQRPYPILGSFAFGIGMDDSDAHQDDVHFLAPYMKNFIGRDTFGFEKQYYNIYNEAPDITSTCYYKATHLAVEAMQNSILHGKGQIREDRRTIREALTTEIQGHFTVGKREQGKSILAEVQFSQYTENMPDMMQEVLDGNIILTKDGIAMKRVFVIYVDMDILEVSNVDLRQSRFSAVFDMSFRYPASLSVPEQIEFVNSTAAVVPGTPIKEETDGDFIVRTYQYSATFKTDFDLRSYPFVGEQKLKIQYRHPRQKNDQLIFVSEFHSKELGQVANNWNITKLNMYQDKMVQNQPLPYGLDYAGGVAEIVINKQNALFGGLWLLFPPLLTVAILIFISFFSPASLVCRLSIMMTVLTLDIIFHLKNFALLPVACFSILDSVYIASYVLILLTALLAVLAHPQKMCKPDEK